MATSTTTQDDVVHAVSSPGSDPPVSPEQLEVEEPGVSEENIIYPSGLKLWLTMASLCPSIFLNGLVSGIDILHGSQALLNMGRHD
jgi:hypothetical protein